MIVAEHPLGATFRSGFVTSSGNTGKNLQIHTSRQQRNVEEDYGTIFVELRKR